MRKLALLGGLAAVMVLVLGGVAKAVPPEHSVEHVDETFPLEGACSFTVLLHIEGDIRHMVFFNQAGNVVRELQVFPGFRVTFTNPETGKSISTGFAER